MASVPLIMVYATTVLRFAVAQGLCTTPSGETGICEPISKCSTLMRLAPKARPASTVAFSSFFCGIDKTTNTVQVCCPLQRCSIPDGGRGTCVELESCPHLMNTLQPSATVQAIQLVYKHICASPELDKVCCASEVHIPSEENENCQTQALPPNRKCCGYQVTTRNRIIGGEESRIDEYPWLVLIEYRNPDGQLEVGCGGALISGQFVLTAAHCFVFTRPNDYKPVSVRLGDYNISNPGVDYVPAAGGGLDHNNGELSVSVERIVVHPNYDYTTGHHDIAVIKLARIVEYTDFIRPICLPTADFTTQWSIENVDLYVAGWGYTETPRVNDIKLKVRLPYVPNQVCRLSPGSRYERLWEGQICAGGEIGKDACRGDSGGPVMKKIGDQHEVVGLVSFGAPCNVTRLGKQPGVNTKVFTYLPWIRIQITELLRVNHVVQP